MSFKKSVEKNVHSEIFDRGIAKHLRGQSIIHISFYTNTYNNKFQIEFKTTLPKEMSKTKVKHSD